MPRDPKTGKRTKPSRPREVVKAELLADPHTRTIAESIKMPLEKYVEMVLDYAYNPEKEPVLTIAPDDQLREAGYEPPSGESVGRWLRGAAQIIASKIAGNQVHKSEFKEAKEGRSVIDVPPSPTAEADAEVPGTPREDLLKDIKAKTGRKA